LRRPHAGAHRDARSARGPALLPRVLVLRVRHAAPVRAGRRPRLRGAMSWERYGGLRAAIAQLAAQIMYGEDVKQYFTAKRLAAKRLLGQVNAKAVRYRPHDLPSNGEIKEALLELVTEIEGDGRTRRLFAMRIVALEAMEALEPFYPRL